MAAIDVEKLQSFLAGVLRAGRFQLQFEARPAPAGQADGPEVMIEFTGPDEDLLLARGAELMLALEHVTEKHLGLSQEERGRIVFDCHDYLGTRDDELRLLAQTAAERVISTGAPFALSPMNSKERRTVHLTLQDNPAIRTESEGVGSRRQVVIYPAEQKKL